MDEKKVKGSMFMDRVRVIRANKDKDWDKYLQPEDWDIINSKIMAGTWYPLEKYKRFGMAAFHVLGQGDFSMARYNGRVNGKSMFEKIYKNIVAEQNTLKSIAYYVASYRSLFNFSSLKFEKVEDKHARVHHDWDPSESCEAPYCHEMMGIFDVLIEMTGGRNARIDMKSKQWEGAAATTFDIIWE